MADGIKGAEKSPCVYLYADIVTNDEVVFTTPVLEKTKEWMTLDQRDFKNLYLLLGMRFYGRDEFHIAVLQGSSKNFKFETKDLIMDIDASKSFLRQLILNNRIVIRIKFCSSVLIEIECKSIEDQISLLNCLKQNGGNLFCAYCFSKGNLGSDFDKLVNSQTDHVDMLAFTSSLSLRLDYQFQDEKDEKDEKESFEIMLWKPILYISRETCCGIPANSCHTDKRYESQAYSCENAIRSFLDSAGYSNDGIHCFYLSNTNSLEMNRIQYSEDVKNKIRIYLGNEYSFSELKDGNLKSPFPLFLLIVPPKFKSFAKEQFLAFMKRRENFIKVIDSGVITRS